MDDEVGMIVTADLNENLEKREAFYLYLSLSRISNQARLLPALACILLGSSRVYGAWLSRLRFASKANDHLIF